MFKGIAVSRGIAFGKAYLLDRSKVCVVKQKLPPELIDAELQRFRTAIEKSKTQLQEIKKRAGKGDDKYAVILDTYCLLLEDEILVNDTIDNILTQQVNAEFALSTTLSKFMELFNNINDEYLKGKKDDLELVVNRVIRNLVGHEQETMDEISEPIIVVAHQLSPSDMLVMNRKFIQGIATESGGKTSHLGIIASAMGIPAVVGAKDITAHINTGDYVVIDGLDGAIIINPPAEKIEHYQKKRDSNQFYERKLLEDILLEAATEDGRRVQLMANIESAHEIKTLSGFGAEGVGLYRTEFIYLGRKNLPDENELFEDFKRVTEGMDPYPVVIRTLDVGGDKILNTVGLEPEGNPALGLRGIRLSLAFPEMFITQLKGILRASLYGNIKILYPMVSFVDEIIAANQHLEKAKQELRENRIPFNTEIEIGAMIETPASALCIEDILQHVDFISIGTNDLIQYVLAVDRANENIAHLYQPFHPAILKTLRHIFTAANKAGKKVSICGELGGDPMATQLLLGLGMVDQLSMDPHYIPRVKKIVRSINLEKAHKMANHCLNLSSVEEINGYITAEMTRQFPADFSKDLPID